MATPESLLRTLAGIVGPRFLSTTDVDRTMYSADMWPKAQIWRLQGDPARFRPDAIVRPASVEEVQAVVRACAKQGTPLIPYGGGSGVCGGTLPTRQGVILDLKRLDRVLEIDPDSRTVRAEAGLLGEVLERTLAAAGFTLGHFPSSIYCSTVGGWLATRSAGQYSSRYGKIEDMALSLRFVDGRGDLHDTAVTDPAGEGVQLLPLLVGSEGVLGIVVDAVLRVRPLPEVQAFHAFEVPSVSAGIDLLRALSQRDTPPLVLRLYDPLDTLVSGLHRAGSGKPARGGEERAPGGVRRALDRLVGTAGHKANQIAHELEDTLYTLGFNHPQVANRLARLARESCLVVVGYDGDVASTGAAIAAARVSAREVRARDLGEGPGLAWFRNRHRVSFKQAPLYRLGACVDTMEVATTWDNLGRLYDRVIRALSPLAVVMAHFSHTYADGCSIYFTFATRAPDAHRLEQRYDEIWRTAMDELQKHGGILSHHHGVGLSKRERMGDEIGAGVRMIRAAKTVLDPAGILNPEKLIPW